MSQGAETLARLDELIEAGKLGVLGRQIKVISSMHAVIAGMNEMRRVDGTRYRSREEAEAEMQEQMIEDLKGRTVFMEFGRYGSSIEHEVARSEGWKTPCRNYTLYMGVEGTGLLVNPIHFHWNGSWEGLDDEMKRDARVLTEMGFKLDRLGYNPERDILF